MQIVFIPYAAPAANKLISQYKAKFRGVMSRVFSRVN